MRPLVKFLIPTMLLASGAVYADHKDDKEKSIREEARDLSEDLQDDIRDLENEILEDTIEEDKSKDRDKLIDVYSEARDLYKKVEKDITSRLKKKPKKYDDKYDNKYSLEAIYDKAEDLREEFYELRESVEDLDSYNLRSYFRGTVESYRELLGFLEDAIGQDDGGDEPSPEPGLWVCRVEDSRGDNFFGFGETKRQARRYALENCENDSSRGGCGLSSCQEKGSDDDVIIKPNY